MKLINLKNNIKSMHDYQKYLAMLIHNYHVNNLWF